MSARILLLEDDPASRELVEYLLEANGHEVIAAARGDQGVELARQHRPDLILCDIQLPGLDGYAIANMLKNDPVMAKVPIIAVTALAMVGDREKVLAAGFDSYIAKPIDPVAFVASIEPFLKCADADATTAGAASHRSERTPTVSAKTLLAIDDVAANLELKRSIFEPLGYIVLTADTGGAGLVLAAQHLPHLIISAIDLPDMTGFELLRRMKSDPQLREIPVLVVTTHGGADAGQTARSMGASAFLSQPVAPQVLIDVAESCLDASRERWQTS